MYSLSVNCTACEHAYKQWLCAVTIPRCEDFSSTAPFLRARNAGQEFLNGSSLSPDSPLRNFPASNRSRNPLIDSKIKPGPYKEILTCQDVCHTLVKNCPALLGFSCPQGQQQNWSYGMRDDRGIITCNYLGAAYYLSTAWRLRDDLGAGLFGLGLFWVLWGVLVELGG